MLYRFVTQYRNYRDIEAKNLSKACLQLLTQDLCEHQAIDRVYRFVGGLKEKNSSWKLVFKNKEDQLPFG